VDQFICHVLQDDEEHTKLPDLEVAQMDISLECDSATHDLKLEFCAVAGPSAETINSDTVTLFRNALWATLRNILWVTYKIGVIDGNATDKTGGAKQAAGGT
jgi:hypothetical protein